LAGTFDKLYDWVAQEKEPASELEVDSCGAAQEDAARFLGAVEESNQHNESQVPQAGG